MMCAHEPSTHNINCTHVIVDIMLSLDNQWIEEVLGSVGTTGLPYWTAADRPLQLLSCMMYKFDIQFCNGFFATTRHSSTKLSRAIYIQKRM